MVYHFQASSWSILGFSTLSVTQAETYDEATEVFVVFSHELVEPDENIMSLLFR